ncbi:MAG: DUF2974 domain-containing protein [Pseudobutyrivibrio sp.]|nr:DUF2974 domain-containing protein [Pseudobutyrivibrio sp.]
MTDEELLLVEQLTYIDKDVLKSAGINPDDFKFRDNKTVKDTLELFGPKELLKLREADKKKLLGDAEIGGALMSGNEIADVIEAAKSNENIKNLRIVKSYTTETRNGDKVTLGVCYQDPSTKKSDAIVTFKGTSGYDEWKDNVKGINVSDTKAQKEAKDFIDRIPSKYRDITVVGHSKGANKAMYVTIADESNRINRCVAFDGQGFSYKFMHKYREQIAKRGNLIKNYSLEDDFVHILMLQIPGSEQIFCKGYGVDGVAQNHSPNSFFMTHNGSMLLSKGNKPHFDITNKEGKIVKEINGFINYVMAHSTEEELNEITVTLGPFLGKLVGEGKGLSESYKSMKGKGSDLIIRKIDEYLRYKEYSKGVPQLIKKEKVYVEGYSEVLRNYTDEFYEYLMSTYDTIAEVEFFDVNSAISNFYGDKFLNHIDPSFEADGIHKEYTTAQENDDNQRTGIDEVFKAAKELDSDYKTVIKKRTESVTALTEQFLKDFGLKN